jgi:hypothetical protein
MVALTGLDSATFSVSFGSTTVSPLIGTEKVLERVSRSMFSVWLRAV